MAPFLDRRVGTVSRWEVKLRTQDQASQHKCIHFSLLLAMDVLGLALSSFYLDSYIMMTYGLGL